MEVILLKKVSKLGDLGAKVRVKAGFGRNYLIPTGCALPATAANLKTFEAKRAELEKASAERLSQAQARASLLEGLSITITANAGEEGRLFGSVGAHEIVRAMKELGHEVAKNEIALPESFRQIGEYEVELHLVGEEVTAKIRVSVVKA